MENPFFHFANAIGGKQRHSGKPHRGVNPSNKQPLWEVPIASEQDMEDAVSSANSAFEPWSKTTWEHRREQLLSARSILLADRENMAELLTKEGGKPIELSHVELEQTAHFLEFNANQPAPEGRIIQDDDSVTMSISQKPIGVAAAICPWNFPLVLAVGKVAVSLLTGNCVITKPSPFTPYSILKFAQLVQHFFPPGVLQALHGDESLGPKLVAHSGVHKISFTGSTATGRKIALSAAATFKDVTLEMGGNNASIICPDVDPRVVAPQLAIGSFINSCQFFAASKRVYVHEDIYDEFLEVMVDTVKSFKVAPTSSLEKGITLGPMQNERQYNMVKHFFEDSKQKGHKFAVGKDVVEETSSFLIRPTIIDNPPDDALVVTGEAFGPIVPVLKWKDEDDVIRRANDTPSGLGGAVWSSNIKRAQAMAARIEAGSVWINGIEKPTAQAHFCGYKESGLGGEWGAEGLLAYCKPQVVHRYKAPLTSSEI